MLCIVHVMVHPTNHINFSKLYSNLHCDSSVILLNLYGISIDTRFYSYMVHATKSLTSVGLAQARPNNLTISTNKTKSFLLMQNLMGFLLQFTETGYYNHN